MSTIGGDSKDGCSVSGAMWSMNTSRTEDTDVNVSSSPSSLIGGLTERPAQLKNGRSNRLGPIVAEAALHKNRDHKVPTVPP